uniref:Secreted protein n=1 Tax=Arundo donax TaxID=35708 RepID=A0A0A9CLV1_ARUDO
MSSSMSLTTIHVIAIAMQVIWVRTCVRATNQSTDGNGHHIRRFRISADGSFPKSA